MFFYLYRGRIVAALAGVAALVALFLLTRGDDPPATRAPWVLVDVSGSTRLARPRYSQEFRTLATQQSLLKDGKIQLLAIKGDPAGESDIRPLQLGVTTNNPSSADIDRRLNVLQAAQELDLLLRRPTQRVGGSALVEGLWLLAGKVKPGDTIYVYSDGLQDSGLLKLYKRRAELADTTQIERIIDELESRRYIADMQGVTVRFVLPGFTGGRKSITDPSQVQAFWTAWADRTHAILDYG
jgi:hypothetical protein